MVTFGRGGRGKRSREKPVWGEKPERRKGKEDRRKRERRKVRLGSSFYEGPYTHVKSAMFEFPTLRQVGPNNRVALSPEEYYRIPASKRPPILRTERDGNIVFVDRRMEVRRKKIGEGRRKEDKRSSW